MRLTSLFTPKFAIAALVVLLACGGIGWYWWTTTPQYALSQIRKAYETHNTDLALKYIDVDKIFDNLWASIEAKMAQQVASTDNGFAAFGALLGQTMVQNMKPTIKENLRTQLLDSIKTGATATSSIASLSAHYSISHDGDTVIVSSSDSTFKLHMEKENGVWRIVAIDGLSATSSAEAEGSTSSEETSTAPERSAPVVKKTAATVKTAPVQTSLPKSDPVPQAPKTTTTTRIENLAAIRFGGGIWENWNADSAKDGPAVDIVYLDGQGDIISDDSTKRMPISADVKLYAGSSPMGPKNRLVFSAHYTKDQIILGHIYPHIRIPKDQIGVNPAADYQYGVVAVTIQTPEQGSFSDTSDFIQLYED